MTQNVKLSACSLFTDGIKPAFMVNEKRESDLFDHLINKFPVVRLNDEIAIFFQNEQLRDNFANQIQSVEMNSPEYHRIIGEALGYPPQAVDFFVQCMENPDLREKRAHFSYAGMNFAANVEQALEITYWLWKNVRIPMTNVKIEYLGVKYSISPNT